VEVSPTGIVIFAVTYLLISVSRLRWLGLDRPAAALLGAVLCVVAQALTPAQALAAIDGSTLLLLFGVMGMGAFLAVDGFFAGVEAALDRFARTPARLLGSVVWGAGALSAFITNDAVCVLAAPILVRIIERHRLPPLPYLLALATAANTGSVATLVGNPQNMLCASLGALSYRDHVVLLGPVAVLGLALNHGLLRWMFRRELRGAALVVESATPWLRGRALVTLAVIASSALVYTAGADLAWTATAGFVLLMLLHRRDTRALWPRIDWALLLFFSGLFVVVDAFVQSGAPAAMFAQFPLADGPMGPAQAARLTGIFLVGSNVVSNVPFILVVREQMATLAEPAFAWELLAMASTFAGNLTLLGSVANIIVAESARDLGGIGFLQYLRVGFPLAVLTTGVGLAWMLLVRAM
jgi:Na+/H+ antiporter NhaD/arsenite permease-like protein